MLKAALATLSFIFSVYTVAFAQNDEGDSGSSVNLPSGIHMNEDGKLQKFRTQTIWSISPLHFSEDGVGIGVSYEKGLDKDGIVSVVLPVATSFSTSDPGNEDKMFYFMPGFKFYPTSCRGKVKYAITPSVIIGGGIDRERSYNVNYYHTHSAIPNDPHKTIVGFLVGNSINFMPAKHIFLSLEMGFGVGSVRFADGYGSGTKALLQGGFNVGYRK